MEDIEKELLLIWIIIFTISACISVNLLSFRNKKYIEMGEFKDCKVVILNEGISAVESDREAAYITLNCPKGLIK